MNCILLGTIHSVLTIYNCLLQSCIVTVVKQRTSQPRLYTVAYVTAHVTLNCECYLATFYHLRWLYGAEWERSHQESVAVVWCFKSVCAGRRLRKTTNIFWTASGLAAYQMCNNAPQI